MRVYKLGTFSLVQNGTLTMDTQKLFRELVRCHRLLGRLCARLFWTYLKHEVGAHSDFKSLLDLFPTVQHPLLFKNQGPPHSWFHIYKRSKFLTSAFALFRPTGPS